MSQPLSLPSPLSPWAYYGLKLHQTSAKINVCSLFAFFVLMEIFPFCLFKVSSAPVRIRNLSCFLKEAWCFPLFTCLQEWRMAENPYPGKDWESNSYNPWISPFWLYPFTLTLFFPSLCGICKWKNPVITAPSSQWDRGHGQIFKMLEQFLIFLKNLPAF